MLKRIYSQFCRHSWSLLLIGVSSSVYAAPQMAGEWHLVEQTCVAPNKLPERIGPDYPGNREEFKLSFTSASDFVFEASYDGLMGDNCSLKFGGKYRLTVSPPETISSIRMTPNVVSLRKTGQFEAPCRVLSFEKPLTYETRLEKLPGKNSKKPTEHLRLQATDVLSRCNHKRAKMELLFEAR